MKVTGSKTTDMDAWLALAREVEPLFGPMVDDPGFQQALNAAIVENTAFCIRAPRNNKNRRLAGGIIISRKTNEIAWLAVCGAYRGRGYGRQLLQFAVGKLNRLEDICVQTFEESVPEGGAARKLYLDFGFKDYKIEGLNPAGAPTVIMRLPPV